MANIKDAEACKVECANRDSSCHMRNDRKRSIYLFQRRKSAGKLLVGSSERHVTRESLLGAVLFGRSTQLDGRLRSMRSTFLLIFRLREGDVQ